MIKKVLLSLIETLAIVLLVFMEIAIIRTMIDSNQTNSYVIEDILKNVDNNSQKIVNLYSELFVTKEGFDGQITEIKLELDDYNYEFTEEVVNVFKDDMTDEVVISYGISEGKLYLEEVLDDTGFFNFVRVLGFAIIAYAIIYLIYKIIRNWVNFQSKFSHEESHTEDAT